MKASKRQPKSEFDKITEGWHDSSAKKTSFDRLPPILLSTPLDYGEDPRCKSPHLIHISDYLEKSNRTDQLLQFIRTRQTRNSFSNFIQNIASHNLRFKSNIPKRLHLGSFYNDISHTTLANFQREKTRNFSTP